MSQSQAAPAPDYAGDLPAAAEEVEVCSCEEALALRAEVAEKNDALVAYLGKTLGLEEQLAAANAEVERLRAQRRYVSQGGHWCARAEKAESSLAAANALLVRAREALGALGWQWCETWIDIDAHLSGAVEQAKAETVTVVARMRALEAMGAEAVTARIFDDAEAGPAYDPSFETCDCETSEDHELGLCRKPMTAVEQRVRCDDQEAKP